jgi:hypothetical protein
MVLVKKQDQEVHIRQSIEQQNVIPAWVQENLNLL